MCADLVFRESDGFDEVFEGVELKRSKSVELAHLFHHLAVAAAAGLGILVEVCVGVSFEFADDAAGEELHFGFGGSEV